MLFERNDTLDTLDTMLRNQRELIETGRSRKFACQTEEEKKATFEAIEGFYKLMDDCYQRDI